MMASFSGHFTGADSLFKGFDKWAAALDKGSQNADKLDGRVDKMVASMRALGRFAQSAGRWLGALFGPSIKPGIGLIDRMTRSLDKASENMRSDEGRAKLTEFFENAIDTSVRFYNALKPLVELFVHWASVFRPFTDAALKVVEVLGKVLSAALDCCRRRVCCHAGAGPLQRAEVAVHRRRPRGSRCGWLYPGGLRNGRRRCRR
jgi:hypothetical protein